MNLGRGRHPHRLGRHRPGHRWDARQRDGHGPGRLRQHRHRLHRHGPLHEHRRPGRPARQLHLRRRRRRRPHLLGHAQDGGHPIDHGHRHGRPATITGTQSGIAVNAGPTTDPHRLGLHRPDHGRQWPTTSRSPPRTRFGNTATGYRGTVHFTSSDGAAVLPADYTFVGRRQRRPHLHHGVTLKTAGTPVHHRHRHGRPGPSRAPRAASRSTPAAAATLDGLGLHQPGHRRDARQRHGHRPGRLRQHRHRLHRHGPLHQQRRPGRPAGQLHLHRRRRRRPHLLAPPSRRRARQSITATDTATGTITGTQSGITVNAGRGHHPHRHRASPPRPRPAAARNVTVTAQDAYGNTATGYTGTVHFTSSDGQAVLPADYTFAAGDNGTHTFTTRSPSRRPAPSRSRPPTRRRGPITGTQSGITVTRRRGDARGLGLPDPDHGRQRPTTSRSPPRTPSATPPPATAARSTSPAATVPPSCRPTTPSSAGDNGDHTFQASPSRRRAPSRSRPPTR